MPRRPKPPDPTPAEIEAAFAAHVAWLAKFGDVLPRHLIWDVRGVRYSEIVPELQRWLAHGRLVEDEIGDFTLSSKTAENLNIRFGDIRRVPRGQRTGEVSEVDDKAGALSQIVLPTLTVLDESQRHSVVGQVKLDRQVDVTIRAVRTLRPAPKQNRRAHD